MTQAKDMVEDGTSKHGKQGMMGRRWHLWRTLKGACLAAFGTSKEPVV